MLVWLISYTEKYKNNFNDKLQLYLYRKYTILLCLKVQ